MAEAGVGVDIVQISRMERIRQVTPGFFTRVFTAEEVQFCETSSRPMAQYACRFAAREAVLKALGTGFGSAVRTFRLRLGKMAVLLFFWPVGQKNWQRSAASLSLRSRFPQRAILPSPMLWP